MINWFRLGRGSDFISAQLPQQELSEYINGLPVRIDLAIVYDRNNAMIANINIVYDGYSMPTRQRYKGYASVHDDKYAAIELDDGFIYLGVNDGS